MQRIDQPAVSPRPTVMVVVAALHLRIALRQCLAAVAPVCECLEAGSGEEALGIAEAQPADLVLMDLHLPGLPALDATRRIKQLSPGSQVVLLAEPYETACLQFDPLAGPSASICKDFLYEELDLLLPLLLARYRAAAHAAPHIAPTR
jgi:two-component system, NarL family, response regulator LiaR